MKIITAQKDKTLIVRITGDIDHHSAQAIRAEADAEMEKCHPERMILDLTETEFMDSSGLGLILGRMRKAGERGVLFQLLNPSDQVMKILRLSGVEKQIDVQYL